MTLAAKGIFIIGAKRTPFCKFGGPLRELPASHIFAAAAKDAIHSAKLNPEFIDNTNVGNLHFLSQCDGGKTPRYCGIYSGVPLDRPALGVIKSCATGLQSVITGAVDILTGLAQISLTGGTENMSALPYVVRNVRFGTTLGMSYTYEDLIQFEIVDSCYGKTQQALCEGLAKKYGISRKDVDEFAVGSHLKWHAAQQSKRFAVEISPLTVTVKNKEHSIEEDELPDPNIDMDTVSKLAPYSSGTVVTAGNSASPADGAAAILLANESSMKQHQVSPLARLAGWAASGLDAADAVRQLMVTTGVNIADVDLFEVNETFAVEVLSLTKELAIDIGKVNANGGAVAVGNPTGASGARQIVHLVHQLRAKNLKRGVAVSGCRGGQGVAILVENI